MFDFFRRKRNKKDIAQPDNAQATSRTAAPGTALYYSPELIEGLLDDHQQLLQLFGQLSNAATSQKHQKIPKLLEAFGSMLRDHLLAENIKLYIYLQRVLANDAENATLIRGFRTEMNSISKTVTNFLDRYSEGSWDDQRKAAFTEELEAIGGVLVKRIKTEESALYPLYMPPEAYQ